MPTALREFHTAPVHDEEVPGVLENQPSRTVPRGVEPFRADMCSGKTAKISPLKIKEARLCPLITPVFL